MMSAEDRCGPLRKTEIEAAPLTAFMRAGGGARRPPLRRPTASCTPGRSRTARRSGTLVWDFCGVIGDKGEARARRRRHDAGRVLLSRRAAEFRREPAAEGRARATPSSFAARTRSSAGCPGTSCAALVSRLQQAVSRRSASKPGDRVAAMMPNMPETVAAMLAAASLGAVWSSCSPDFGEQGVLDRFGQIEPVLFIACDGYWYNGKAIDVADKVAAVAAQLPTVAQASSSSTISARADAVATASPSARRRSTTALAPFDAEAAHLRAAAVRLIRSTSCFRPARPACRNASCIRRRRHAAPASQGAPAALPTSRPATACSTSPPAAG